MAGRKQQEQDIAGVEAPAEETTRRGRKVSALITATRAYEAAHAQAEKGRSAAARVQPLVDALSEAEAEEARTYEDLQAQLRAAGLLG